VKIENLVTNQVIIGYTAFAVTAIGRWKKSDRVTFTRVLSVVVNRQYKNKKK
jgi:hypothetical protein